MNPRRVHELMEKNFPPVEAVAREWKNLVDAKIIRKDDLADLIDKFIPAEQILVEVNRFVGDYLPRVLAIEFIAEHVGKGNIRLADRRFKGFVYVASSGVATGWNPASTSRIEAR